MKEDKTILYIFSGLPGVGKTTLAKLLSKKTKSVYLRIDTVEQGINDLCSFNVEGEGYRLTYRIASDNLKIGNSVVSDSTNPIALTRNEWEQVAVDSDAHFINIEILCSDKNEHKRRVESRESDIQNLCLPSWEKVNERVFDQWQSECISIDTSDKTIEEAFTELLIKMALSQVG